TLPRGGQLRPSHPFGRDKRPRAFCVAPRAWTLRVSDGSDVSRSRTAVDMRAPAVATTSWAAPCPERPSRRRPGLRRPAVTTRQAGGQPRRPLQLHRPPGAGDRSGELGDRLPVVRMAAVDEESVGVIEVGRDRELVVVLGASVAISQPAYALHRTPALVHTLEQVPFLVLAK